MTVGIVTVLPALQFNPVQYDKCTKAILQVAY
jgi:hypothetical protein